MNRLTKFGRKGSRRDPSKQSSSNDDGTSASILSDFNGNSGYDLTASEYARKCRELMQINKILLDLGAGDTFPLPRVTVIGGQSAGKSSLIEAVSGINVPRDSGTCTRCPMECVMSSSGTSWSCTVSLKRKQEGPIAFSPVITDPSEVELWIRRAQTAILNPHRSHEEFKDKDREELRTFDRRDSKMLKFSMDMVLVELQDPELTDLFFFDLPGLIQNAEQDIINLVRDLVVSHIDGDHSENNIILITIPMSDDIENQQAVKLARECDPEGLRTIGVLTKPDMLSDGAIGSRKKWQDVLEGREHPLKHGYYCVCLPDDAQRSMNLSRVESQRRELEFFETKTPWSQMSIRDRFGIPCLVSDVSKLLVTLIESNLPKLKAEVNRLLMECQEEMRHLPKPPSKEPAAEVSQLVNKFCKIVEDMVIGEGSEKGLVQLNRQAYAEFKFSIWNTSLDFRPFIDHEKYRDPCLDDESFNSSCIPSPERRGASECVSDREILDLEEVREVIVNSIAFELPGHVPFEATKTLVKRSTDEWRDPTIACFNTIHNNLCDALQEQVSQNFNQYGRLEKLISSIVRQQIEKTREEALRKVEGKVEHEQNPLYTQNYRYLSSEKAKWSERYRRAKCYSSGYLLHSGTPQVASAKYWNQNAASDVVEIPRDEFEDELNLMANVQAYFKVAYNRFVDGIPLLIEHDLNQALAKGLAFAIFEELLSGDTSQKMKDLLAEDPSIAARRKGLSEKIEKLSEIKARLAVL